MSAQEIAIYGAGGFGREVAWLVQSCNLTDERYRIVCFIDDNEANHGKVLNNLPVMSLQQARQRFPYAKIVGGVGDPRTRQTLMEKAYALGSEFATIIHPSCHLSEWVDVGVGTVICAGSILTTNIVLGRHVQINLDCTIGHDVIIGDYTTLAPGVHVSGWVHIGKRVYIGTGAVIVNGRENAPIVIGDDVIIGAAACVTKSIASGLTVVGVPAKPLQKIE